MKLLLALLLISAPASHAFEAIEENFCGQSLEFIQRLAHDDRNLTAFDNAGLFGVCWWHSRLQRAALYLAHYRPDIAAPSPEEAKAVVDALIQMDQRVTITGFRNWKEFTTAYQPIVQERLENWLTNDGARGSWVYSLSGATSLPPDDLRARMEKLYNQVTEQKLIVWQKLNAPGLASHAWLVVDAQKVSDGIELGIIDSNYHNEVRVVKYTYGTSSIEYNGKQRVPYTGADDDLKKIMRTRMMLCRPELRYLRFGR